MQMEPLPPPTYPSAFQQQGISKPGQITAIAVLCLVSGILDCLGFVTVFMLWPGGLYSLVVGIFELIYAAKILSDPVRTSRPSTAVAVLQIVNIINCSGLAVVTGILSLVFYSDPRVKSYFHEMARRGVPG